MAGVPRCTHEAINNGKPQALRPAASERHQQRTHHTHYLLAHSAATAAMRELLPLLETAHPAAAVMSCGSQGDIMHGAAARAKA